MLSTGLLVLATAASLAAPARADDGLTGTETTWLDAAAPVIHYALQQGMPVDVVVQPQDTPGLAPLGLAWVEGRCKLVLSMRGNPRAQAELDRIAPALLPAVVQAIAAHELAHCWRHTQQVWGSLPAGMTSRTDFSRVSAEQAELIQSMWRTRREEGFADLVGLAWTLEHNPAQYEPVHAWLSALRGGFEAEGAYHDTRVWVRLAQDKAGFTPGGSIFEQVGRLWADGLRAGS